MQKNSIEEKQCILRECTEVRFASFLSGGFTTMEVINPPEKKLSKPISVEWCKVVEVGLIVSQTCKKNM